MTVEQIFSTERGTGEDMYREVGMIKELRMATPKEMGADETEQNHNNIVGKHTLSNNTIF